MKRNSAGNEWNRIYETVPLRELPRYSGKPAKSLVELIRKNEVRIGKALDVCCGNLFFVSCHFKKIFPLEKFLLLCNYMNLHRRFIAMILLCKIILFESLAFDSTAPPSKFRDQRSRIEATIFQRKIILKLQSIKNFIPDSYVVNYNTCIFKYPQPFFVYIFPTCYNPFNSCINH